MTDFPDITFYKVTQSKTPLLRTISGQEYHKFNTNFSEYESIVAIKQYLEKIIELLDIPDGAAKVELFDNGLEFYYDGVVILYVRDYSL